MKRDEIPQQETREFRCPRFAVRLEVVGKMALQPPARKRRSTNQSIMKQAVRFRILKNHDFGVGYDFSKTYGRTTHTDIQASDVAFQHSVARRGKRNITLMKTALR